MTMGAPIGNQYYKLRSKDGKDKQFKTPDDLRQACNSYFEWAESNPLQEEVAYHYQGTVVKDSISKMRPFTIQGLCNYIDLSVRAFMNYEQREDYIQITTRVRQIIYNQKYEGAASGFLNPNIIARDLGLVDKKDVTTEGQKINDNNKISLSLNGKDIELK